MQLRLAPGTGLQSPETGSQNRRYRDLSRQQRPHVPHLNPRKCPQICGLFVRDRETLVRIGLRGGGCSPHRTSLHPPQFPLSGKLTAYFARLGASRRFSRPIDRLIQWLEAQFPTQRNSESFSRNSESFSRNSELSLLNRKSQNCDCVQPTQLHTLRGASADERRRGSPTLLPINRPGRQPFMNSVINR